MQRMSVRNEERRENQRMSMGNLGLEFLRFLDFIRGEE